MVFIPTQVINFAFVPHHLRVLTVGVVSLFWSTCFFLGSLFCGHADGQSVLTQCDCADTYLSMVNNASQQHGDVPEQEKKLVVLETDVD